jgi:protease II
MANYLVVLFKDKKKKRIINKFITPTKAQDFFNKKMKESEDVIFDVRYESGKEIFYEMGIVHMSSKQETPVYLTDEFGRNLRVKLDEEGMTLIMISPFKKEEKIFDIQKNKKIDVQNFIRNYLKGVGVKMISMLNNKIIVQEEEKVSLFTLKNESESSRFIDCVTQHFYKIKRGDCLFVKDFSKPQKKYLYQLLENKGYDKSILYRKFTSLPRQE